MRWTKLKHKYKNEFLHESVRARVDFHFDVYRKTHDQDGQVLRVSIDGETVFKGNKLLYMLREHECSRQIKREAPELSWREASVLADQRLAKEAIHSRYHLTEAMREIMILPIKAALQHEDPIIRAFALLDKRVGRRRLEQIQVTEDSHPLIRLFYQVRSASRSKDTA
ncbi:hypothetical protein CBW65_21685 [Tumebacillus avium]|uniref:Uncharacterized protein n=1 Tax=Tumebacillus avium TaxID=1903704 RepID=A0A1Y0IV90_9BACL|nr:hypothetical protein [Tumebacillus avium]ARU63303.1 hypothetical protein CBW65_21685 [Tumebacillus avium]